MVIMSVKTCLLASAIEVYQLTRNHKVTQLVRENLHPRSVHISCESKFCHLILFPSPLHQSLRAG